MDGRPKGLRQLGRELHNHIVGKWNPVFQIGGPVQNILRNYLDNKDVKFSRLGHTPSVMANLLDSGDNGGSSRGFGRSSEWASAGAQALRGGRRTRKKRGGWQTPEKLESISRYSPIRRVERKKKKKEYKKT